MNASVRQPAVAGLFYPGEAAVLRSSIEALQRDASVDASKAHLLPKALIVPHAGYPYSGRVAAAAYSLLAPLRRTIRKVVIVGPSHRVFFHGIALPLAARFATPLGEVHVDEVARDTLTCSGAVVVSDAPHAMEHCLEVQLPFLQCSLEEFSVLPLVIGSTTTAHVTAVLEAVWGGEETLIVASSDLSHYLSYDAANDIDAATADAIVNRQTSLSHEQACGAAGINGLLQVARNRDLVVTEIVRENSGDTAGDRQRVVGYGAFAIHETQRQ